MGLKVIGAGFGRTGTRSLKVALEELGFGKCYHMEEVIKNPGHLNTWAKIMEEKEADWATLFKGYQSATDWPAAAYYRELMGEYPDAKIILTIRNPARWHRSIMNTIYQLSRRFRRFTRILPSVYQFLNGMEKVVWNGIFQNKVENRTHAIRVFKEHIEEVKRTVPKERLLIFKAKDGWEPLCEFLDVPVLQNKPYPHKNKGAFLRQVLKFRGLLQWGIVVVLVAFLFLLVRVLVM